MKVDFDKLTPFNEGATDMDLDWLTNTSAGRNTYARYLEAGGEPFDEMAPVVEEPPAPDAEEGVFTLEGQRFRVTKLS